MDLFFDEVFDVFPGSKQFRPRPVATGHREVVGALS